MPKCARCGGQARRIHRTFRERLRYLAVYECRDCYALTTSPHRWALHTGPACRCPRCGTYRVTRLKSPDKIDGTQTGLLNLFERLAGGDRYHCRYCRVQFFDRRPLRSEVPPELLEADYFSADEEATIPPDTAKSDE